MKLHDLLPAIPSARVTGLVEREIGVLRYDSRFVQASDVFFAWRGDKVDGHQFIPEVTSRGASAVVLEDATFVTSSGPTFVEVPNARRALAQMAALYYGQPSRSMSMIGITGTNGKTTTSFLLKQILEKAGQRTGLIGTVQYEVGSRILPATRTTPEGSDLQELLAQMKEATCRQVVMEVSSHALQQGRVSSIDFSIGVFTNLTQDHLDYHGTMDAYFAAKALLFESLNRGAESGAAVLNADDVKSAALLERLDPTVRRVLFSAKGDRRAEVRAERIRYHTHGTNFELVLGSERRSIKLPLPGAFNVSNALAAASAAWLSGVEIDGLVTALNEASGVPGRMETLVSRDGVTAVVDYAHTEDALRKVLQTLRALEPNRLFVVVGCGGNRDKTKRPLMAQAAVELADLTIFTADNPRQEKVEDIIADMTRDLPESAKFSITLDRRMAIAEALALARPGDVVCIAGKGHESTQEIAGVYHPFDDRHIAQEFLQQR
jgi:UDP-N-acetylmuramoyl-L-alanyl-D-glutamate--2,6-diaminopimelate ligase